MKEVFFKSSINCLQFFFKLFPTCRLCWHCIPILVKLSTRYGRQHQAYFIIKRLLIKTLFIIDKESCYRSRHVLLDAVYILIYWWNMCHCHLKNQHQFIIYLLWKTFESWKINCKEKIRQCWCIGYVITPGVVLLKGSCCSHLFHPVTVVARFQKFENWTTLWGGYWLHTWMWNSYE